MHPGGLIRPLFHPDPSGGGDESSSSGRKRVIIAGFELKKKLGEGAVGVVFLAKQLSMERLVALKILQPELARDPSIQERFLSEARLSARLNHLHIINGIDCGIDRGYTYFAMEYVDGPTGQQMLRDQQKLPPQQAFDMIREIADALIYAHGQGLVHRDIKPDNIMITSGKVAKLCDLGLAKKVGETESKADSRAGMAVGTPHYISPEQARADRNFDGRTDIYSLGATFYHLLTGHTPFQGGGAMVIMAKHLTETAPSPCDEDPGIPIVYGVLITRMMAKAPEDRYASAEELKKELDAIKDTGRPLAPVFRGGTSCALPKKLLGARGGGQTTGSQTPCAAPPASPDPSAASASAAAGRDGSGKK
ncbi:MAG: serine/threonine protein kinase [Planctomycetota bacterium]|nr:serine/threonine protein kinase [Planctomycetota bacterium]